MKPTTLKTREVQDIAASKNFEILNKLLSTSPFFQIAGEFREFTIKKGTDDYRHSLGYSPIDIIVTYNSNNSLLVFNYANFSDIFISITSSEDTVIRCIIGRVF